MLLIMLCEFIHMQVSRPRGKKWDESEIDGNQKEIDTENDSTTRDKSNHLHCVSMWEWNVI